MHRRSTVLMAMVGVLVLSACSGDRQTPPGPAGWPAPSGITPNSVAVVSPTEWFVLADSPCGAPPCTSILRTRDTGRSWASIPAPRAPLPEEGGFEVAAGGVSAIRFASALDGWVFGPSLYATHDGGTTWSPISLPGSIIELEASAGQAFARLSPCPITEPHCDTQKPVTLWHANGNGDDWSRVPNVPGDEWPQQQSIFVHGTTAWVIVADANADNVLFFTGDGVTWTRSLDPCSGINASVSSIATVASTVGFLCSGAAEDSAGSSTEEFEGSNPFLVVKTFLVSSDGGRTTHLAGRPPADGSSNALVALSPTTWIVTLQSLDNRVSRSTDGGRSWSVIATFGEEEGLSDLRFMTASQGVAIRGMPFSTRQLIISQDSGATWQPGRF